MSWYGVGVVGNVEQRTSLVSLWIDENRIKYKSLTEHIGASKDIWGENLYKFQKMCIKPKIYDTWILWFELIQQWEWMSKKSSRSSLMNKKPATEWVSPPLKLSYVSIRLGALVSMWAEWGVRRWRVEQQQKLCH